MPNRAWPRPGSLGARTRVGLERSGTWLPGGWKKSKWTIHRVRTSGDVEVQREREREGRILFIEGVQFIWHQKMDKWMAFWEFQGQTVRDNEISGL